MVRTIVNKFRFFKFLLSHPLTSECKMQTLARFLRWQVSSRIALGSVAVRYVDETRLLVKPGMTGATMNVYAGLDEFEDMAFVLHILRSDDLFVDVGANIGSYTVLSGGAVGAKCISIEPIPGTFSHLMDNINLNCLVNKVTAMNIGVGRKNGCLSFTAGLDTVNHVATEANPVGEIVSVPVRILDDVLRDANPLLIKIDVEGYETNVIEGASRVLSNPSLLSVLLELNGSGHRYGFDEGQLHKVMLDYGFGTFRYLPFGRALVPLNGKNQESGNTLYLRNLDKINERIVSSRRYYICGTNSYL